MKRIKPVKPVELTLVVEVPPYHWSERPCPDTGPSWEFPEQWDHYFHQCMADAGIEGLQPIRPGSSFVEAFSVVENDLMLRIIRECLNDSGLPGFSDAEGRENVGGRQTVSSLEGSYAVLARDNEIFEPQCCCSFGDLANWKRILVEKPNKGLLWIGHPEAIVEFRKDTISVSQGWEGSDPPESIRWFSISDAELSDAVAEAQQQHNNFSQQLLRRVCSLIPDEELAGKVTNALMDSDWCESG